MENQIYIVLIFVAVVLACLARYLFNRHTDDSTEKQLVADKRTADELTNSINISATGLEESKELSDRIRANQQSAERTVTEVTESVRTAKERSRSTIELTDECLKILEEAEKAGK